MFSLTGRDDAPLPDTLPDPAGRHSLGPAGFFWFGQRVRGRGGLVVRHQVSVVRHKVPPQFVKVLRGDGQEELHPAEDVQQSLQRDGTLEQNSPGTTGGTDEHV